MSKVDAIVTAPPVATAAEACCQRLRVRNNKDERKFDERKFIERLEALLGTNPEV